jgi:CRP/FNR family transcriptional regulator, cyclic AMP receptor protein
MASAIWSSIKSLIAPPSTLQDVFRELPLFDQLTRRQMKEVERIVHQRTYRAGEVIFHSGDTGVALYVLLAGEVKIVLPGETSDEDLEVARLSAGELFGELALLDSSPRSATAVAATPTEAAAIARPDWIDLIHRQPGIGVAILLPLAQLLAVRLRAANRMTSEESKQPVLAEES